MKNLYPLGLVVLVQIACLSPARADDYSWNKGTNSNYGTASNWFDVTTGSTATVAPGINDNIVGYISGSTGAIQFNGTNSSINNLFFNSPGRDVSFIGISAPSTFTVGGTLSENAAGNTLAFRLSTFSLSLNVANIALSAGTLQFGVSTSQPIAAFSSTGSTLVNGGTMNFVVASAGTATLGATTVNAGTVNLYNDTSGTGNLKVGSLAGTGGTIEVNTSGSAVGNLTTTTSGSTTYGGVIANGASNTVMNFAMTGSGAQVLTGTNTYTGSTTITGGTLQLGNGGTTGSLSSSTAITDNGTLAVDRSDSPIISNSIAGSGNLVQLGSGTTILTGSNSFSGTTVISNGAVSIGNGGSVGSLASNVNIQNTGTLIFARTGTLVYGGAISGSTGLISKLNSGVVDLTGANTFSGTTSITGVGGAILLSNSNALQNSTVNVATVNSLRFDTTASVYNIGALAGSGNFALTNTSGSAIVLQAGSNNNSTTYSGDLSGGSLVKVGSGTLTLSGNESFVTTTTISAGMLSIGSGGANGTLTGDVAILGNSTLNFARTGTLVYAGSISGSTGSILANHSGTIDLTGASSFSGTTTVTAGGAILLSNSNALQNSTVNLSNASTLRFDTTASSYNVGGIAGSGTTALQDSGSTAITLNVGGNNGSTTYAGPFTGAGALNKVGTGALTLSGTSLYTGNTTVTAGSLLVSGGLNSATAVTVNGGATLGVGKAAGAAAFKTLEIASLTLGSSGLESKISLSLGATGATDEIFVDGALNLMNGEALSLLLTDTTGGSLSGSYTLLQWASGNLTSLSQIDLTGSPGFDISEFKIQSNSLIFTATPEPSTWALLGAGLVMGQVWSWRKRRRTTV